MIYSVYLFTNGQVAVFSTGGEQLPEYQGRLMDVRERVLADAPAEAEFHIMQYRAGVITVPRDLWACFRYDHDQLIGYTS